MFALATVVVASLAASAFANPLPRQTSGACTGLSSGSTDTPGYNFTLTALNTTLPNSNTTGAPLVLGWGIAGSSPAASDWAISTYAAWGSNQWPYFVLNSGNLLPQPDSSEQGVGAYDRTIEDGGEVGFIVTTASQGRQDPQIYCAEVQDDQVLLALNGDANSFSICQAATLWHSTPNSILVWKADANHSSTYDESTCYGVQVLINQV